MATHNHTRSANSSSYHDLKKAKSKVSRPAVAKRQSHGGAKSGKSVQIKDEAEEDIMAASFLQYCATCEKQITTPNNQILYCSEGCRRKDQSRIPSSSSLTGLADSTPPLTPLQTSHFFDKLPVHDIVPQRSPTYVNLTAKRLSIASQYSTSSQDSSDELSLSSSRKDSDPSRYMRGRSQQQAHQPQQQETPRPHVHRGSTTFSTLSQNQSLSHSSSATSLASLGISLPFTTTSRPLPPRTNPSYSTSMPFSKSIDLVNPFASLTPITAYPARASTNVSASATAAIRTDPAKRLRSTPSIEASHATADGEVSAPPRGEGEAALSVSLSASLSASLSQSLGATPTAAREASASMPGTGAAGLKKLFRFDEMQAPPR